MNRNVLNQLCANGCNVLVWSSGNRRVISTFNIFFAECQWRKLRKELIYSSCVYYLKLDLYIFKLLYSLTMQKMEWILLLTFQH